METTIAKDFKHGENLQLGQYVVIEPNVVVGNNVKLGHRCTLKSGTIVGDNSIIDDHCITTGACYIGNNVNARTGAIISKSTIIEDYCFVGPGVDVPLNSLPLATNGYVTFGSFNNIAKSNDDVLALWAKLLVQVPNARLLLKHQNFRHETVRRRFLDAFQSGGVDPARIELRGAEAERVDHLALYGDVDIALDPFPYNGTTTTCEALWMGVPVIGLAGDVLNSGHHARIGESLLTQMELEDLIATSKADYLRIAAELASDGERLREMRKTLRARLQASTLGQIEPFAAKLEAAYEVAWRDGG